MKNRALNCKSNNLKNENGITLVALVVTIIVLLILAGVSLSAVFSQDGIFRRAEQATDKHGQAKAREALELALGEAQMQKYEEGLTDEQLTDKINSIGEDIKDGTNTNISQAIVDGYIFEIDRTVPKILDYLGPADGIIITAVVTQNGNWKNPTATVTGTITKYGGGLVTSSTATATEGVTITGFPTTGGSYTIPNITKDTDITITASADDGKPAVTKTIKVRLVRDTTGPVISNQSVAVNMMKITIKANAVDNESGLASLTYSVSPADKVKDNKETGTLTSGAPIEIETTEPGNYTVTFTAKDNAGNSSTVTAGAVTTDVISVEEAKRLVTSMDALQEYIGTKVDYKTGETWQIFYYDEDGEFGPTNILYLKKAVGNADEDDRISLTLSTKTTDADESVQMMRRMNPMWASSSYSEVNLNNEKACVWLCDTSVWNLQRNTLYSSFAIGSPSVEMYMKAYNVYKTGNKDANNLVCKIENANGYLVGANGIYSNSGYYTDNDTIAPGPYKLFHSGGENWVWIASPSNSNSDTNNVFSVKGDVGRIGYDLYSNKRTIMPVVPLDM